MLPTIRHETAPMPMGCRWCGAEEREHVQRWVPSKGWHGWEQPTRKQINRRLWARLAKSRQARIAVGDRVSDA